MVIPSARKKKNWGEYGMPVHRIYLFGNIRNLVIVKVKQMKYKKREK